MSDWYDKGEGSEHMKREIAKSANENPVPHPMCIGCQNKKINKDMYEALERIVGDFEDSPVQGSGEWETGLFCGLEDMGITDRYQACRHGYDKALDKVREWLIDGIDDVLAKAKGE